MLPFHLLLAFSTLEMSVFGQAAMMQDAHIDESTGIERIRVSRVSRREPIKP
jgi:hypothetical protein